MGVAGIEALGVDNCQYYEKQRDYETGMHTKYTWLVFALAVAVAASLIGLVIAAAVSEWGVAAASAIGTIVTGAAAKFIFDQRAEHRSRADDWVAKLKAECAT